MKSWIIRRLIDFCCKNALKYEQRKEMLHKMEGINYIYSIGSNVIQRDKWLKRIYLLEKCIGRE